MDNNDEAFMTHLLETFKEEAKEHIDSLESLLFQMVKHSDDVEKNADLIEQAFRESHSLKGASRSVSKGSIEIMCKEIESLFSLMKQDPIALSSTFFDNMHETVSLLNNLVEGDEKQYASQIRTMVEKLQILGNNLYQRNNKELIVNNIAQPDIHTVVSNSDRLEQEKIIVEEPKIIEEKETIEERIVDISDSIKTVKKTKISVEKLVDIIRYMEEFLFVKLAFSKHVEQASVNSDMFKQISKGEDKSFKKDMIQSLEQTLESLKNDGRTVARMVDDLLEQSKKLLMFPFSSLLESFAKVVYDLSTQQNKKVDFSYEGGEIEIDRRILDEMKDPLIHLIRNSIDHGIELPAVRGEKNKSQRGRIDISVRALENSKVEIRVKDDGAGIDIEKLKQSSLNKGLISKEKLQQMDENDILKLVFRSGVTTNKIVTDLSGRGLGLAIVEEKAQKLGGSVDVKNLKDGGALFSITLPLLIATYRGVLIRSSEQYFIIPASTVERVVQIESEMIKTVEDKDVVVLEKRILPLHSLYDLLNPEGNRGENLEKKLSIVVLEFSNNTIALHVDEIVTEQEVLVKDLGRQLKRVKNIAGSTILANGKMAFILHIPDLFLTASTSMIHGIRDTSINDEEEKKEESVKSILVVDDSITTRTLIANILDMAGYRVIIAVDGVDAAAKLMGQSIDLVISDIDMPRMNGFELTKKIRADKQFEMIPVILVTSLESQEDKQRGLKAGANAYIIKSAFDQKNLLETVQWMI